ncbi:hypothetical protein PENTCL1PPCAC_6271 [Pristionchus entomophagus]|uniref:Trcs-2 n=1 Tax=Pristionchus entomophagus TaxID=358040 RepID=A0AAV5SX61_9BILA|nr:hypothetical protein PENTCL1PPCAC_6271 [Pristionchus entomophagus]
MSRSLGDGIVAEVLKTYAYIEDEKLGRVYFPITAANISENCYDLRMKFETGDHVIFTALKQSDIKNKCAFIACSVVRSCDLREKTGKIAEKFDKFCYVDLHREGRVFVPYSARNAIGKSWLGRGSEVGVTVTIKFFCQPVINDCHFVAFTCEVRESVNPATMKPIASQGGAHRSPEFVHEQVGCIVVWNGSSGESQVYSAVTGLASLPSSILQPYMKLGSWIRYIAHRSNMYDNSKMNWTVSCPQDLGMLFEPVAYNLDPTRLQLEVKAVVNRVDKKTKAAWMWNDQIGRVYVPPCYFRHSLRPFDAVQIRVCYTGQFEDVPWTAVMINELGDDATVRENVSLMLNTCDTWRVSHVQMSNGTFYSFLEHDTFGSAFAAWTDYTTGETPPKQGMICRVTVYRQERDKKHIYRAVMVTPLDSNNEPYHYHPPYSPGTKVPNGLSIPLPKAWKEPVSPLRPRPISSPGLNGGGIGIGGGGVMRTNGIQHNLSMSEVVSGKRRRPTVEQTDEDSNGPFTPPLSQMAQFNGFHSNGCDLSPVIGNGISHYGGSVSRDSPTASSVPPSEHDQMMSGMGGLDLGTGSEEYFERSLASPSSESLLHRSENNFYPLSSDLAFDAWRPEAVSSSEHLAPGFRLRKESLRNGSISAASFLSTAEAETQTDIMTEHKILREIMDNKEIVLKIFEQLPHHIETVLSMSALIKKPIN